MTRMVHWTGLKVLNQAQRDNDNIGQAMPIPFGGQGYRLTSQLKALDYHHKTIAIARKTNNQSLLASAKIKQVLFTETGRNTIKAAKIYLSSHADKEPMKNESLGSFKPRCRISLLPITWIHR